MRSAWNINPEDLMKMLRMPAPDRQISSMPPVEQGGPQGPYPAGPMQGPPMPSGPTQVPQPPSPQLLQNAAQAIQGQPAKSYESENFGDMADRVTGMRGLSINSKAGESFKEIDKSTTTDMSKHSRASYSDAQQLKKIMDTISNDPSMQALVQGQQANKELLVAQMKATPPQVDLSSLANIMSPQDAETFLKSYSRPMSQKDRMSQAMDSAMALQKEASDIQKSKMDLFGKLKSGMDTYGQNRAILEQMQLGQGGAGSNNLERTMYSADARSRENAINKLKSNPVALKQLLTIDAIKTAFDQVDKMKVTTPEQVSEAMQTVRNATTGLTGGSRSGISERHDTYMQSLERNLLRLKQNWNNNIQNIPADDPQLMQIKRELMLARASIAKEHAAFVDTLTGGVADVFERHPDWEDSRRKLVKSMVELGGANAGMSESELSKKGEDAKQERNPNKEFDDFIKNR